MTDEFKPVLTKEHLDTLEQRALARIHSMASRYLPLGAQQHEQRIQIARLIRRMDKARKVIL